MNRAKKSIEDIFEFCLAAIQQEGRSIEDCLAPYPEPRAELEPMLQTAVRLEAARSLRAPAQFKVEALQRLQTLAASKPQARKTFWGLFFPGFNNSRKYGSYGSTHIPFFAYPLAGLLAVIAILVGVGAVASSAQTLPGDFLYPVKLAQENVRLSLTANVLDQADLHMEFANQRMVEASALVALQRTSSLDQVLSDYNQHMQTELAFISPGSSLTPGQQSDLAVKLLNDIPLSQTNLSAMISAAPSSSQNNLETALATSTKAYNQAVGVLNRNTPPTSTPPPPTSTSNPVVKPPLATNTAPQATPTAAVTSTRQPSAGNVPPTRPTPTSPPPSIRPTITLSPTKGVPSTVLIRTPSANNSGTATATRPVAPNAVKPTATP